MGFHDLAGPSTDAGRVKYDDRETASDTRRWEETLGSREPAHKDYKLSVLIPCYNEKDTIEEIVRRVQAVDVPTEIVIVDDGSTDGTRDILRRIEPDVDQVIFHEKNLGKGGAIQTGAKAVTGDYVCLLYTSPSPRD